MASLAVIVPATNSPRTLTQCLAAIRSSTDPPEELVVVEEPNRYGPAAARNAGVGQTASDVLVFVDADVVLHRDALTRIRDAFDGDDALDALFGSYDDRPGALGVVSQFRNLLHHHVHQNAAGPATTFWAGLGAMRRDVFLEAGGFDAYRFPGPSIEDIELGARLVAQGRRIACDPLLQGTHLKRWTMLGMLRVDLTRRGIPWIALLLESKSPST
ncbi:MAG: glycosyltransferase family 2 protein, partial [Gaiellaceae bacterium]